MKSKRNRKISFKINTRSSKLKKSKDKLYYDSINYINDDKSLVNKNLLEEKNKEISNIKFLNHKTKRGRSKISRISDNFRNDTINLSSGESK